MAKRISLREFQEKLVRQLAEAQTSERKTVLGVETDKESWLVDLTDTGEILPVPQLAPVPLTRPWYRGIANVRGTLYGVVDFSGFSNERLIPPGGSARLLVLSARHGTNCALLFSRASGLRSVEDFEPAGGAPDERPWVAGRLRDAQGKPWLKLDVRALIGHPAFLEAGVGTS
ncbi:MAG: chemotaxis protein CheW [Rhodocyclaceae bacterium]|jgi:twitching motility protein PilI|nr:chemotaxis protein CheW [Rhodocyclaceae bacterium]MCL4757749.1 chemotaxis protein CheW [Rhodocyclaceae bacterium]